MNIDIKEWIIWVCIILIATSIATAIIINVNNSNNKKYLDLSRQIAEVRKDVDILTGKMQVYENLPIDLISRIEVLETRYDNLIFFQNNQLKKPITPPKNAEIVNEKESKK